MSEQNELKQEPIAWLIDGGLIYTLGSNDANSNEINVTMVNGSRSLDARNVDAHRLVAMLSNADERKTDEQIRDAALEEAAKLCDSLHGRISDRSVLGFERFDGGHITLNACAKGIRALMGKEGKS
jgi:hypothetical protein